MRGLLLRGPICVSSRLRQKAEGLAACCGGEALGNLADYDLLLEVGFVVQK